MREMLVLLKALSDETRLGIMELLLSCDFCVCALSKKLGLSEAAISQHLRVLREAGIVRGEKRGYFTHYAVDGEVLKQLGEKLSASALRVPGPARCRNGSCPAKERGTCG